MELDDNFDYREFANRLRFQVRALVPGKFSENEKDIQNIVYNESLFFGKLICEELPVFDKYTSAIAVQIIAEWTFHKYIDLLAISFPEEYGQDFIRKINLDIYSFLSLQNPISLAEYSKDILNEIENIVKKSYKKYLIEYEKKHIILKSDLKTALKQSNVDELSKDIANQNLYTAQISIFEILKVNYIWSIVYILTLPICCFAIMYFLYYKSNVLRSVIYLVIFCGLLFRFLTKKMPISISITEEDE